MRDKVNRAKNNPTELEIHVFPGQNNTYRMYEDDGISSLYQEGYFLKTEISYNYLPNNYTVILRAVEGKKGIVPDKRNYIIRFRNTKETETVSVYFNETQIAETHYVENNDFIVEVKDVPTVGVIFNLKNNYDWKDKQEIEADVNSDVSINIELSDD